MSVHETHQPSNATDFAANVIGLHGDIGAQWLEQLPDLLGWCAAEWSLMIEAPFVPLTYNYVTPVRCADGERGVLKLSVPTKSFRRERRALELFRGHGAVRLLKHDLDRGAMLLQRAEPGAMLSALCPERDMVATSVAVGVMRRLQCPVPEEKIFLSVADWGAGLERLRLRFGGSSGPFPSHLVDRAEGVFRDLLSSMDEPALLHGDLHHFNILSHGDDWLVIDPQGVIGEPAYETGALLRNPMPQMLAWPDLKRLLQRRIHQLAEELDLDRKRIHGWGLAQAVLAGWWSFEDHESGWEEAIHVAQLLSELRV